MRRVVLESPYAGDVEANVAYAKRCLADCIRRGEAPIASHLLFPGTLDDDNPEDRKLGMAAGHAWISQADAVVVYTDRGVSSGMLRGVEVAGEHNIAAEYRTLGSEKLWAANTVR